MLPDVENRKLPPVLAYPFIATSFFLLIAILIRLLIAFAGMCSRGSRWSLRSVRSVCRSRCFCG
jgi:hypothetical protein